MQNIKSLKQLVKAAIDIHEAGVANDFVYHFHVNKKAREAIHSDLLNERVDLKYFTVYQNHDKENVESTFYRFKMLGMDIILE